MSLRHAFFCGLLFMISAALRAQDDTSYYTKYRERFIVTYFQSKRSYNIAIGQKNPAPRSGSEYYTSANDISGFAFNYDIFGISIGFRTPVSESDKQLKGTTRFTDIGFTSFGNKIAFDVKYKNYKGFYDQNTGGTDTILKTAKPYYRDGSMNVQTIKGKFYYFYNNKKFSFASAYSYNQRQNKSVGSWFFISNLYYFSLTTDSSVVPYFNRKFYGIYGDINSVNLLALSGGMGGSYNFVWKKVFLNLTLGLGLEAQQRSYGYRPGSSASHSVITIASETRAALGYNGDSFYMSITGYNDYSFFTHSFLDIRSVFNTGGFNLGYRFKVPKPKLMSRIQETWWYQLF